MMRLSVRGPRTPQTGGGSSVLQRLSIAGDGLNIAAIRRKPPRLTSGKAGRLWGRY